MNIDIDFNSLTSENTRLFLCKPNRDTISEIHNVKNINIESNLGAISQITFDVPMYVTLEDGEKVENRTFSKIRGNYLIRLERGLEIDYYIITEPTKSSDDSGEKQLEVVAFQQQYEWKNKIVRSFEGTYLLYDPLGDNGVLNRTLLRMTDWTVDYIDSSLITGKYRTFDTSEQDLLSFVLDAIETYGTYLPIVDTVNKRLSVYKVENFGRDRNLRLEHGQYLKSISENQNFDDVVTRLYIYGNNNLSVNSVNPSGTDFIENFQFFRNGYEEDEFGNVISHSQYMSDNLCKALNNYDELLITKKDEFTTLLQNKSDFQVQRTGKVNELNGLNTEMSILQDSRDTLIGTGGNLTAINAQIAAKQIQVNSKQQEINTIDSNISGVDANIVALRNAISKEANFTSEEIIELNFYTREKVWRDTNYDSAEDLYEQGEEYLNLWSLPQVVYSIDSIDFINMLNFSHDKNKLRLGDIITVYYPEFDIDIKTKLISYSHDLDSNSLTLTIANTNDINSPFFNMKDSFKRSASTSTSVDMSKHKWDLSESNNTELNQIMNNKWDANKRAIEAGSGLNYSLDERGITLKSPDDPLNYLRAVHNVIALTNDGGNTFKNALTSKGLVAEVVHGILLAGENLTIQNEGGTFLVNENGVTVQDMDLTITRTDGKNKIILNETDGIKIQSSTDGENFIDRFIADSNGNLILRGDVEIGTGNDVFKATIQGIQLGHSNFTNAPFSVTPQGKLKASDVDITGGKMKIGNHFYVDENGVTISGNANIAGNISMGQGSSINWNFVNTDPVASGAASTASSAMGVAGIAQDMAQRIADGDFSDGTFINGRMISTPNIFGGTIKIGSGSSVFKADTSGIYLGDEIFGGAPFRVTPEGNLTASSANIQGKLFSGNPSNYLTIHRQYADLTLYQNDTKFFEIYNALTGIDFISSGINFLSTGHFLGNSTYAKGTWQFSGAVSFTGTVSGVTAKFA